MRVLVPAVEKDDRRLFPAKGRQISMAEVFAFIYEKGIGRQGEGVSRQVVIKNYFEPQVWEAPLNKGKTPVIWRHRTFEEYVKTFTKCGLTISSLNEPRATKQQAETSKAMEFLQRVPLYLFWKLTK